MEGKTNNNKSRKFSLLDLILFIILFSIPFFVYLDYAGNRMVAYEDRIDSCNHVIETQKIEMDAVSALYEVDFEKMKSEKLDSALILLEIYRDKLHYDSLNRCWYVTDLKEIERIRQYVYRDIGRLDTLSIIEKKNIIETIN